MSALESDKHFFLPSLSTHSDPDHKFKTSLQNDPRCAKISFRATFHKWVLGDTSRCGVLKKTEIKGRPIFQFYNRLIPRLRSNYCCKLSIELKAMSIEKE